MYGSVLLLHLLGATVWTGGHLILVATVLPRALRSRSTEKLLDFESAFEKIGIPALLVQVATGLWLAHRMVPEAGRWLAFGDPVARLIGFKLLLLAATVALALDARLRLIPRLSERNLGALARHIVAVSAVAVLYVVVGLSFRTGWLY